jgi:hypothetical protein
MAWPACRELREGDISIRIEPARTTSLRATIGLQEADAEEPDVAEEPNIGARRTRERKSVLVRMDPAVYDALARWAADDLRSTTAQIELVLRRALQSAGRLPGEVGEMPKRGRPPRT